MAELVGRESRFLTGPVELFWKALIFLFCASVYASKAGVSLFGFPLLFLSLLSVDWKAFLKQKHLVFAVTLYPMAIFLNLFSLGGFASASQVATNWTWTLLVIPFYVISQRRPDWFWVVAGASLGLVVACSYSLYQFLTVYGASFAHDVRVDSFWDILRWGVFLSISALIIWEVLKSSAWERFLQRVKKPWGYQAFLLALFYLSCLCLFLANTRASWLSFIVVFTVMAASARPRRWKSVLALLAALFALNLSNADVRERIFSIVAVEKDDSGRVTSQDKSNAGRLHMWKVALDFFPQQARFGTGFRNTVEPLSNFLSQQSDDYLERYTKVEFSYSDQHSSFVSSLVQMGLIFFIVFWSYFAWLLFRSVKDVWTKNDLPSKVVFLVLLSHSIIFLFYSSYDSYEMILLFPFLPLLGREQNKKG